jgi:hypothetical protein
MSKRAFSFVVCLIAAIGLYLPSGAAQTLPWSPPAGIPVPPWGINESAPAAPNPWLASTPGFYYVDESNGNATDTSNPYGTPARPRRTIPTILPAGSVVELHGTYTRLHTSPATLRLNGTAASPVYIRGVSSLTPPAITSGWEVSGTHFILENLDFGFTAPGGKLIFLAPIYRGAMRTSVVHGNAGGGGVGVYTWSSDTVRDFLLFRNVVRDNGDWHATFDQDFHGISVSALVSNLWVLENELTRNSGDGIQINAASAALQPTTHHIYVGRNVAHHNKQTGFWTKQAEDVIFSENLSYSHRPSDSSTGACMGFQYAPERVWFINNHLHDCEVGIGTGSDSGLGTGQTSFYVGNVIHNIHSPSFNPGSGWGQAAMMLNGGTYRIVLNNTISDVDAGINSPSGIGAFAIVNNIIANVTHPQGSHIFLEGNPAPANSSMHHNLLTGPVRIKWGDTRVLDLATFQALYPGKGLNTIVGDPRFLNPAGDSFGLQPTSPAIDKGVADGVYSTFKSLYGIDLAVDGAATVRPHDGGWDIGALEYPGTRPRPPTNVRIIK